MRLTFHEIAYALKTWNSWYLIAHDSYLKSEFSENITEITIEPFNEKKLSDDIIKDLSEYTDTIDTSIPGKFRISFVFSAGEHQPLEILDALRPVLNVSEGSKIEIKNIMEFTETELPRIESSGGAIQTEIDMLKKKYAESLTDKENKDLIKYIESDKEELHNEIIKAEEKKDSQTDMEAEEPEFEAVEPLHNEIIIKGIIKDHNIESAEFLHNGKPLENIELFIEASRLFETIEKNFEHKKPEEAEDGENITAKFDCADENEAMLVNVYLASSLDVPPLAIKGKTIETTAESEELAAVVTYIRYMKSFKGLFNNPYLDRLRLMKKYRISEATKALAQTLTRSCSCFLFAVAAACLFFLIYWISAHKK